MAHEDLPCLVKESWTERKDAYEPSATLFKEKAKKWNYEVFGNILQKKRRLQSMLEGIQRALERKNSKFLVELEKQLIQEYSVALLQENNSGS